MASGRSARLPPTPQQQQPHSSAGSSTTAFLSTHSAGPVPRYDVSPNNNHHPPTGGVPLTAGHILHHQQQQSTQQFQHSPIPGHTLILDNHNSAAHSLGPELAAATSQVLDSLSDRERRIIINVLKRDDNVRQRDAARIM